MQSNTIGNQITCLWSQKNSSRALFQRHLAAYECLNLFKEGKDTLQSAKEQFAANPKFYCERFEPRSHFKSRLSLIVRVNVVLNRTVVVDSD